MVGNSTGPKRRKLAPLDGLVVTIIWSSSFVVVKFGLEPLGPLTIAGVRYIPATTGSFLMRMITGLVPVQQQPKINQKIDPGIK